MRSIDCGYSYYDTSDGEDEESVQNEMTMRQNYIVVDLQIRPNHLVVDLQIDCYSNRNEYI